MNPGLHGKRLATTNLSHGTALSLWRYILVKNAAVLHMTAVGCMVIRDVRELMKSRLRQFSSLQMFIFAHA
jgi:hypothetical protein